MKTRIIQTRFWDDDTVIASPKDARYLYIHLLTCNLINICGIFQYSPLKIQFTTGLTPREYENASNWLHENKKILFYKGWVFVINARKNNRYENAPDNKIACEKEIDKVPEDVKSYFNSILDSSVDTSVPLLSTVIINKKQEIRNKKEEIKSRNFDKPNIEEIKAYCLERKNNVNAEKFFNYYESNGWRVGKNSMKDWKAAVRTWESNSYSQDGIGNNQKVKAEVGKYSQVKKQIINN